MALGYTKISEVLKKNNREDLLRVLVPLVNNVKQSYLINEIVDFLSDSSPLLNTISDKNKVAVVSLMSKYYNSCSTTFLIDTNVLKMLPHSYRDIYKTEAASGIRVSTKREVEEGAIGLVHTVEYPLGEDKYKALNMLAWTITGKLSYYRNAGYSYRYDKETGLVDSIYDMALRASSTLQYMMDWVGGEEFDRDMEILKAMSKKKYTYPEYAPDEILSTPSKKQVAYYVRCNIPRKSNNQQYRKALGIALKDDKKITPAETSMLRGVYLELLHNGYKEDISEDNTIKQECEYLLQARDSGKIDSTEFVFKIIDSLNKSKYRYCTDKQYKIIREAPAKVNRVIDTEDTSQVDEVEYNDEFGSILDISDALGSGNLGI